MVKATDAPLKGFVVIESLDGAGGTTQADELTRRLRELEYDVLRTSEPSTGPIGKLIRRALGAEFQLEPQSMALLFAADRTEHLYNASNGMIQALDSGSLVVCDRYLYSSLAYQSIECGWDFVASLNNGFPVPSDLIFLSLPISECSKRVAGRTSREIYEDLSIQERVAVSYERVLRHAEEQSVRVHRVDGSGSAQEVAEAVWKSLQAVDFLSESADN